MAVSYAASAWPQTLVETALAQRARLGPASTFLVSPVSPTNETSPRGTRRPVWARGRESRAHLQSGERDVADPGSEGQSSYSVLGRVGHQTVGSHPEQRRAHR